MKYAALASFALYIIFTLLYFKKIFGAKRSGKLFVPLFIAAVLINLFGSVLVYAFWTRPAVPAAMFFFMMIAFFILFQGPAGKMLYAGGIYVFSIYCIRGIIVSAYSLIVNTGFQDVLANEFRRDILFVISIFLTISINLLIRKSILSDKRAKNLFNNKRQIGLIVIYLISQIIFLTFVNDGRYYDEIRNFWYSYLYLISCLIAGVWLLFVLNYTARVSELLEYEIHTSQLQKQLTSQLNHYQSYSKFTESYRAFQHDYKNMMITAETLLANKEYDKAIHMINEISNTMQKNVQIHKTYSDNILLDAIMQDASNKCGEKNIRFSASVHLPGNIVFSELDIVKIFTNIIDNAVEACENVPESDRFIEITSKGNKDWAYIEVSNSYNVDLIFKDGILQTRKEGKDFHGLGLKIISETAGSLGGLASIEPDTEKKIFRIKLCFPKISD